MKILSVLGFITYMGKYADNIQEAIEHDKIYAIDIVPGPID